MHGQPPDPPPYAAPPAYGYAPPDYRHNAFHVPAGAGTGALPSPALKAFKVAGALVGMASMLVGLVALVLAVRDDTRGTSTSNSDATFMVTFFVACAVGYVGLLASSIVNAVWVHRFWRWIPPDQRYAKQWKSYISPGQAAGFLFIPYFNIYWFFVVYLGIADALDRLRVARPTSTPAPKGLAIAMLVCQFVFFPAAPFLQFLFAWKAEELAREMERGGAFRLG